jgi:hypothetical protein
MVRIALSLTGHMRNFTETFPSLEKYILDPYDPDIYIQTFDTLGFTLNACRSRDTTGDLLVEGFERNSGATNINDVKSLYNPKRLVVEEWDLLEETLEKEVSFVSPDRYNCDWEHPLNPWSMWRKWYLSYQNIQRSGIEYDYIIRFRPDLWIEQTPIPPEGDELLFPVEFTFGSNHSDAFAMGSPKEMGVYLSIYKKVKDLFESDDSIKWNPHSLLGHYLDVQGVDIIRKKLGIHKVHPDDGVKLYGTYHHDDTTADQHYFEHGY